MLYTIGHSTHEIEEFIKLLKDAGVEEVLDVRTLAGSNKFPQFNSEELAKSLPAASIKYELDKRLGGLRKKSPGVDKETNAYWQNASFKRYADYALGDEFHEGFKDLLELSAKKDVAVMCAEAVWWRCHRRIIADYALAAGQKVTHIMPSGKETPATLTPGAVTKKKKGGEAADVYVSYPAPNETSS